LAEFDEMSTQVPVQQMPCPLLSRTHSVPEAEKRQLWGCTQTPLRQTWVLPHSTPHPPQFWGSSVRLCTQVVPQQVPPIPHSVPSWPPGQVVLMQPKPPVNDEPTHTWPAGQSASQDPPQ
jgi:hypothetical protein